MGGWGTGGCAAWSAVVGDWGGGFVPLGLAGYGVHVEPGGWGERLWVREAKREGGVEVVGVMVERVRGGEEREGSSP